MRDMTTGVDDAASRPPARRTASRRAYEWIRDAILNGDYAEGEFIDEVALAEQVGTSRTPVREALQRLQVERFVDLLPRRGAQVRVVTATEMREIYQARYVLEAEALRTICRERTDPGIEESMLNELARLGAAGEWNRFAQLDQAFHSAIVRAQGNAVMSDMYDSLRPRQVRLGTRTLVEQPGRLDTIHREHRELLAAIARHDAEASVEITARHLRVIPELVSAFSHDA